MTSYTPAQFTVYRILFGAYLAVDFGLILPYAAELFSSQGMPPNRWEGFPSPFLVWSSPGFVTGFVGALVVLALLFAAGVARRISAVLLWYGLASLVNQNNQILNPSVFFTGWALLACALIPRGEPLRLFAREVRERWEMPATLYWGAWLILAVGYSISGYEKLQSEVWRDGSVLVDLLGVAFARDWWFTDLLLSLPAFALMLAGWAVVLGELLFAPLSLFRPTRKLVWALMLSMHGVLLLIISERPVALGMILFHLFLFDARWLPPRRVGKQPILLFDGSCGFCDRFVRFVLQEDRERRFRFASLGGQTAARLLDASVDRSAGVVLVDGDRVVQGSSAVLDACAGLGGIGSIAGLLRAVPRALREPVYAWVARHRHGWFGELDACRGPVPDERDRFLT